MENLPTDFNLIVVGTGLPESIIAAAASRIDRTVLQLDSNTFYGRDWAGFRLQDFRDILKNSGVQHQTDVVQDLTVSDLLKEGESAVAIRTPAGSLSNFQELIYAKNDVVEPDIAPQPRQERYRRHSQRHASGSSVSSVESQESLRSTVKEPEQKRVSFEDMLTQTRKFSLDIAPKLFWTTDSFVKLLTTSNISRYASFRLVHWIASYVDGHVKEVPFSRSGIYNHTELNAIDKRKVMKFMQLCMEPEKHPKEMEAAAYITLGDHLQNQKIPAVTRRSIIDAIALCSDETPLLQALASVRRFLSACGRYAEDSSPFLFPIFGCGEFPQYFARISAVFGGIQCLKRGIEYVILDSAGTKVAAVVSNRQRIECEKLVLAVEYLPAAWKPEQLPTQTFSRAVLITDGSLLPRSNSEVGFMRIGRDNDELGVLLIEASSVTEICPTGYYVVYMWTRSTSSARADLERYVLRLFEPYRSDTDNITKPKVLWVCYYNQRCTSVDHVNKLSGVVGCPIPENVKFMSGPTGSLDYEDSLAESTVIFESLYPDQPFLPRVPDPEEIVIEGYDSSSPKTEDQQP